MTFFQNLSTKRKCLSELRSISLRECLKFERYICTISKSGLSTVRNSAVVLQMIVAALLMSWRSASSPNESPANISPTIWDVTFLTLTSALRAVKGRLRWFYITVILTKWALIGQLELWLHANWQTSVFFSDCSWYWITHSEKTDILLLFNINIK